MGFLKIRKGDRYATVTEAAYRDNFRAAGWVQIGSSGISKQAVEKDPWEDAMTDLSEKPVSELTPDEVKKVAKEMGIAADGKNVRQLRDEIRKRM